MQIDKAKAKGALKEIGIAKVRSSEGTSKHVLTVEYSLSFRQWRARSSTALFKRMARRVSAKIPLWLPCTPVSGPCVSPMYVIPHNHPCNDTDMLDRSRVPTQFTFNRLVSGSSSEQPLLRSVMRRSRRKRRHLKGNIRSRRTCKQVIVPSSRIAPYLSGGFCLNMYSYSNISHRTCYLSGK